jgi:hypothetical protein
MTPADAKLDLERCLHGPEFDFEFPDVSIAWRAFVEHLRHSVDGVRDYTMAEIATCSFEFQPIRPALVLDLCRQFGHFDEAGEFSHYEQLHLMLYHPVGVDLEALHMSEFRDEGESMESFANVVEGHVAFLKAKGLKFRASHVMQWDV